MLVHCSINRLHCWFSLFYTIFYLFGWFQFIYFAINVFLFLNTYSPVLGVETTETMLKRENTSLDFLQSNLYYAMCTPLEASLQSMAGARASFFKKYISNKGLKTTLHARDLIEFCPRAILCRRAWERAYSLLNIG